MRRHPAILIATIALTLGMARGASADECETDADCGDGMVCEEVMTPCIDVGCPPGEDCPEPEPCEPESVGYCTPAPCASDADCGDDLICLSVTYETCSDVATPACPPGEECPEPDPPSDTDCETVTEAFCAPPWAGPCEVDADCGEGFSCVEAEVCSCSGVVDVPPVPDDPGDSDPDPGSDDDPIPEDDPDCSCEPSGERFCQPAEIECATDGDCPTDWRCVEEPSAVSCTYDAETGEEICGEPEPADSICLPPYWDEGWAADGSGSREAFDRATGEEGSRAAPSADPADDAATCGVGCAAAPGTPSGVALAFAALLPLFTWLRRR